MRVHGYARVYLSFGGHSSPHVRRLTVAAPPTFGDIQVGEIHTCVKVLFIWLLYSPQRPTPTIRRLMHSHRLGASTYLPTDTHMCVHVYIYMDIYTYIQTQLAGHKRAMRLTW